MTRNQEIICQTAEAYGYGTRVFGRIITITDGTWTIQVGDAPLEDLCTQVHHAVMSSPMDFQARHRWLAFARSCFSAEAKERELAWRREGEKRLRERELSEEENGNGFL